MVNLLLIINGVIVIINTIYLTYKKENLSTQMYVILLSVLSSTIFGYITYFYFFDWDYIYIILIIYALVIILIRILSRMKKIDNVEINDTIKYTLYNNIILTISFVGLFISILALFPTTHYLTQLLYLVVGYLLLIIIRFITRLFIPKNIKYLLIFTLPVLFFTVNLKKDTSVIPSKYTDNFIEESAYLDTYAEFEIGEFIYSYRNHFTQFFVVDDNIYLISREGAFESQTSSIYIVNDEHTTPFELFKVTKSETYLDVFINFSYYEGEILIISARGFHTIVDDEVITIFENPTGEGIRQFYDVYSALYHKGSSLIYENQNGVYTYSNNTITPTTSYEKEAKDGYGLIGYFSSYMYISLPTEGEEISVYNQSLSEIVVDGKSWKITNIIDIYGFFFHNIVEESNIDKRAEIFDGYIIYNEYASLSTIEIMYYNNDSYFTVLDSRVTSSFENYIEGESYILSYDPDTSIYYVSTISFHEETFNKLLTINFNNLVWVSLILACFPTYSRKETDFIEYV